MARRAAIDEVRPVLEEVDKVVDVVDKGLDAVERGTDIGTQAIDKGVHVAVEEARTAVHWLRNPKTAIVLVIGLTAAAGTIIGFEIAKRKYTKRFEAEMERELESARKFYTRLNKVDENGETVTPEDLAKKHLAEEAADALQDYKEGPVIPPNRVKANNATSYNRVVAEDVKVVETPDGLEATGTVVDSNIFVNGKAFDPDVFDVDAEERDPESPYVVSQEEFMENEPDHQQVTITYYAGDDILADERDVPIEQVEATVGVDNLARFGHGSKDKNIVYIRNERTEIDFEVAYSAGKFSEEVHGFIEHADRPVHRKMRTERE